MTGPPTCEKAVEVLDAPTTAGTEAQSKGSLSEEEIERNRLASLQQIAARVGASLDRISHGYMLHLGAQSWHSPALDALTSVLARLEGRR